MRFKSLIMLAVAVMMLSALAILPGAGTADAKSAVVTDESGATVTYYPPSGEIDGGFVLKCTAPAGTHFEWFLSATYTAGGGLEKTKFWGPVNYTGDTPIDQAFAVQGLHDLPYGSYTITGEYDNQGPKSTDLVHFDIVENGSVDKPVAATGLVYDGTVQTGVPAGTGYTLTGTASTARAGDYTVTAKLNAGYTWSDSTTDDVVLNWSIAPKTVGIEWSATDSFVYDGASHVRQASLTGIISGDACTPTIIGEQTHAGTGYNATVSGLDNSDYALPASGTESTFAIAKKALTVTAEDKSVTYGDAAPNYTASYSGLVPGDSQSVVENLKLSCSYAVGNNVGTYTISASGATAVDYTVTCGNGTLTVGKAALTIKADNKTAEYGDAAPNYTATFTGLKGGDKPDDISGLVLSCTYAKGSSIGTYDITPSGASSDNYDITFQKGTLTVSKKQLVVPTADRTAFTYSAAEQTYIPVGFDSATMGIVNDKRTVAGTQTVTVSIKDKANFEWKGSGSADRTFQFTVQKAPLTIKADDQEIVYRSPAPEYTVKYSGLKGSDTESVVSGLKVSCEYTASSPVGEYAITPSGGSADNYAISCTAGKLIVTPNEDVRHTVSFNSKGGSAVEDQSVPDGGKATRPKDPTRSSYTFEGWYSDEGLKTKYDFSTPVTDSITLYAKWDSGDTPGGGFKPVGPAEKEEHVNPDGSKETITTREYVDSAGDRLTKITEIDTDASGKVVSKKETDILVEKMREGIRTTETVTVTDSEGKTSLKTEATADAEGKITGQSAVYSKKGADGSSFSVYADVNGDSLEITTTSYSEDDMKEALDAIPSMGTRSKVLVDYSYSISVPANTMDLLSEDGLSILVKGNNESVLVDRATVSSLASQDGDVNIVAEHAASKTLTSQQREVIGDRYAVDVYISVNGERVHELGGTAVIDVEPGYSALYVYYVADNGSIEKIDSDYDPSTGKVVFKVDHFSVYVMSEKDDVEPAKSSGGINYILIAMLLFVAISIAIIVFTFVRRKSDV